MMVEDHPYDYRNFEGIIPSGYGAGTVIVWDEGFYEPADDHGQDKKTQDKELRKGTYSGKLHVVLHGKKLQGEYALVKTHGRGENAWLLFKVKDKFVSKEDITLKDKSVISKKALAQVEKTSTNFYGAKRVKEATPKSKKEKELNNPDDVKAASKRNTDEKENSTSTDKIISKGKRSKFPVTLSPMLATLVDKPFDKKDGTLLNAIDASLTSIQLSKGNNADILQTQYVQKDVIDHLKLKRSGGNIDNLSSITNKFIDALESGKIQINSYPDYAKDMIPELKAIIEKIADNAELTKSLSSMEKKLNDITALQKEHLNFLLLLRGVADSMK